jgi:hypothetical protein
LDLKLGRTDFSEKHPFFEPWIDHNLPLVPTEMSQFTMLDLHRAAEQMLNRQQQHPHHNNNSKKTDITCTHIHSCTYCKYMVYMEFMEILQQEETHRLQTTWSGTPVQCPFSDHHSRYHHRRSKGGIDGLSMKHMYVLKRFFDRCHAKLQRKQLSLFQ